MYNRARDISLKRRVARSFMRRTVSLEVVYYKLSLQDTVYDLYGDSKAKMYMTPIMLVCSLERNPQTGDDGDWGTSTSRLNNFAFLKDDLRDLNLVPEKGDIIEWDNSFYEVDVVVEDQLLSGNDPDYALETSLNDYGSSWSIVCETHLAQVNRLNIVQSR